MAKTQEQINAAIAEACGWKALRICSSLYDLIKGEHYSWPVGFAPNDPFPHEKGEQEVPNYCGDLNAMNDVERNFIHLDQRETYWSNLAEITQKSRMATVGWTNVTATAIQRAEAFLRTIGKWHSD